MKKIKKFKILARGTGSNVGAKKRGKIAKYGKKL